MLAAAEAAKVIEDQAAADAPPLTRPTPGGARAPFAHTPADLTASAASSRQTVHDAPGVRHPAIAPGTPAADPVPADFAGPAAPMQPAFRGAPSARAVQSADAAPFSPPSSTDLSLHRPIDALPNQATSVFRDVDRIPLPRLLEAVRVDWADAVAIVRQLIEQLLPDPGHRPRGSLPNVDDIALEETGRLRAAMAPDTETTLVADVARLFEELLGDADRPAGLRGLLTQAGSLVPAVAFEDLNRELARWERTNRERRLKGLYERFRLKHPMQRPAMIPIPSAPNAEPEPVKPSDIKRSQTKETVLGILGMSAIVGLLVVYFMPRGREEAPNPPIGARPLRYVVTLPAAPNARIAIAPMEEPAAPPTAREPVPTPPPGPSVAKVLQPPPAPATAVESRPPAAPPPSVPAPVQRPSRIVDLTNSQSVAMAEQEFRRAQALFDSQDYRRAAEGFQRVMKLLDSDSNVISELRVRADELAAASRRFAIQNAAQATRIYTSADASVVPPSPMGAFLPPPPPENAPSERVIILHVLVDERGAVESAHVLSTRNHYRDRWWVVAAKAWRFQPATRDGQPVRYLRRVPIFDDLPER